MFIANLLLGHVKCTPAYLYKMLCKSGDSNRNKEGGLGKAFQKKTRIPLVDQAFVIDDLNKTVAVRNIHKLYELAKIYKSGDFLKANNNKYAICLALIVFLERSTAKDEKGVKTNLTYTSTALDELAELYKAGGPLDDVAIKKLKLPISMLIQRKKIAYSAMLGSSAVPKEKITVIDPLARQTNSRHTFLSVTLQAEVATAASGKKVDAKSDSKSDSKQPANTQFIQKKCVQRRIATFEAHNGTLMELYVGPHQPTMLVVKSIDEFTDLLSEKLEFKSFDDSETLKAWAGEGFPGAAEIDIGSIDVAENDYHLGNGGRRADGSVVRIDFDMTNGETTYRIKDNGFGYVGCKKPQRIHGTTYEELGSLDWTQGYNFHEDDLTGLPILPNVHTKTFTDYEWSEHYAPSNWWTSCTKFPYGLELKVIALQKQDRYLKTKFRSMLEKIILPQEVYQAIADHHPFETEDRQALMKFRAERRARWRDKAIKTEGFLPFMQSEGQAALAELKQRLQNFINKRRDIINPGDEKRIKRIMSQYDANFQEYVATLPKPEVSKAVQKQDDKKVDDRQDVAAPRAIITSLPQPLSGAAVQKLSPVAEGDEKKLVVVPQKSKHEIVTSLLISMHGTGLMEEIVKKKALQSAYFNREINKLTLEQLQYLNEVMNKVQNGLCKDEYFDVIRTERTNCLGGGNTKTWRTMRTQVKTCILQLLKKDHAEVKRSYSDYARLFSQHSGRCYSRWGKTNTFSEFRELFPEQRFAPAKKLS